MFLYKIYFECVILDFKQTVRSSQVHRYTVVYIFFLHTEKTIQYSRHRIKGTLINWNSFFYGDRSLGTNLHACYFYLLKGTALGIKETFFLKVYFYIFPAVKSYFNAINVMLTFRKLFQSLLLGLLLFYVLFRCLTGRSHLFSVGETGEKWDIFAMPGKIPCNFLYILSSQVMITVQWL